MFTHDHQVPLYSRIPQSLRLGINIDSSMHCNLFGLVSDPIQIFFYFFINGTALKVSTL